MKTLTIFIIITAAIFNNVSGQVHYSSVEQFMDRTGYSIGIDKSAKLGVNDTVSVDIYCVNYLKYKIVGFNELWGVKDIELYITDLKGNIVAKEDNISGYSLLVFKPKKEGGYRIVMRNKISSYSSEKIKCRLIIASK